MKIRFIDFLEVLCCLGLHLDKAMSGMLPLKSDKLTNDRLFSLKKFEYLKDFNKQSTKRVKGAKKGTIKEHLKSFDVTQAIIKLIHATVTEKKLRFPNQLEVVIEDLAENL